MTNACSKGIWVGHRQQEICVRVVGRGTFQNSQPLRRFALEMIDQGHRLFVVDVGGCSSMDSTFLGVLAGLGLRLRQLGASPSQARVAHANARNRELLQTLGLDRLFCIEPEIPDAPAAGPWPDIDLHKLPESDIETPARPLDKDQTTDLMLVAHEDLVRTDERNAPRFGGVTQTLRARIEGRRTEPSPPDR